MRLSILTIVLDGLPWLSNIFVELNRLPPQVDWQWVVVEGASMPVKDTAWIAKQAPRLSKDGTTEFLDSLAFHPRVKVLRRQQWEGKTQMCNAACAEFSEPGVLFQLDADELATAVQMQAILHAFEDDEALMGIRFWMRYFVGPSVITTSSEGYGNRRGEWLRAWRFSPGQKFLTHEPPNFNGNVGRFMDREESRVRFGEIDHYSWALKSQVQAKQTLYGRGYERAVLNWEALQKNTAWPIQDLRKFLPWVGPNSTADNQIHAMPSLDQVLKRGDTPPPIAASAAHKSRSGPFPRPLTRRFLIVLSFYDGDHERALEVANLIYDLQGERSADTDIAFYHRHDARPMEQAVIDKMKLRFLKVYSLQCPRRNAKSYPYGSNEMFYALIELMRSPKWSVEYYAFLNMEPDCVPLCPGWSDKLSAEFRRYSGEGFLAVGHVKDKPVRHLNGAAVYATEFYDRAGGLNLLGGRSTQGYDLNHAERFLKVAVDTPLMGGHWNRATMTAEELWAYAKDPETPVVLHHGCKSRDVIEAVRKLGATI